MQQVHFHLAPGAVTEAGTWLQNHPVLSGLLNQIGTTLGPIAIQVLEHYLKGLTGGAAAGAGS